MVAVISHGALRGDRIDEELSEGTLYIAPSAQAEAGPEHIDWVEVADLAERVRSFALDDEALYWVSFREAPRGRVLTASTTEPGRVRVLVPEGEHVVAPALVHGVFYGDPHP